MNLQNILVVCVGNICRSPMAEFFLKTAHPDLHIESAGLSAMVGHSADERPSNVWINSKLICAHMLPSKSMLN